MNKFYIFLALFFVYTVSFSQEDSTKVKSDDFNKWSIELNAGNSKGIRPFTTNYFSSNPRDYFNISNFSHYDIGFRKMFNEYFGLKLDVSYDTFENEAGSGSLPFEAEMYGIGLQGVFNLGNLFHFESFTNRFGLLAHGGVKVFQFTPQFGAFKDVTENNGGFVYGITPLFRISNRFALNADFSVLNNVRQHFNWDGASFANKDENLTGSMYTLSIGLNYYIGRKGKVHADWYHEGDVKDKDVDEIALLNGRVDELEKMLNDVDKDGVPDYLDFENNTPSGVDVDTRGRIIDLNNNNIPDELEYNYNNNQVTNSTEIDAIRSLVEHNYLNIFFDLNSVVPNEISSNNLMILLDFMNRYPDSKVEINGYADIRGSGKLNLDLSSRRSKFVYDYLVKSGISGSRLTVNAKGVDNSKTTTNTELNYRLARRVTIVLIK